MVQGPIDSAPPPTRPDLAAMRSRLEVTGWEAVLARPRSLLRGDPVPAVICDNMNALKFMLIMFAVGASF